MYCCLWDQHFYFKYGLKWSWDTKMKMLSFRWTASMWWRNEVLCEQRRVIRSKTSQWLFISCISVTRVSPRPCALSRLEVVLSLFILMVEINVITDYDQFFPLIVTKIYIGPIFHKTYVSNKFHVTQNPSALTHSYNFDNTFRWGRGMVVP